MSEQLLLVCRALITVVFAASALGKARSPGLFAAAMRVMKVVPGRLAHPLAVAVPVVEAGLAAAVWVPVLTVWAFVLVAAVLVVFTAVLVSVLRRGIDASCSCFGFSATPVGPAEVARNCILLVFAAAGAAAALAGAPDVVLPDPGKVLFGILFVIPASILIVFSGLFFEVFRSSPRG